MKGRKPLSDPPRKIHVSLPTSLLRDVDDTLHDPVRNKRAYGSLSSLMRNLLEDWLAEQKGPLNSEIKEPLKGQDYGNNIP